MFDIGFSEMFLILVVALIVVGPEKLPAVARKIGRFIGHAKRSFDHIKREVASELDTAELNSQLAKNNILDTSKNITDELKDLTKVNPQDTSVFQETIDSVNEIKDSISAVNEDKVQDKKTP